MSPQVCTQSTTTRLWFSPLAYGRVTTSLLVLLSYSHSISFESKIHLPGALLQNIISLPVPCTSTCNIKCYFHKMIASAMTHHDVTILGIAARNHMHCRLAFQSTTQQSSKATGRSGEVLLCAMLHSSSVSYDWTS